MNHHQSALTLALSSAPANSLPRSTVKPWRGSDKGQHEGAKRRTMKRQTITGNSEPRYLDLVSWPKVGVDLAIVPAPDATCFCRLADQCVSTLF